MSKDAYWFKHDSNASRDLRLMQIKAIYGLEGLGIFWSIIEILREQKEHSWDEKQVKILAKMVDIEEQKLNNFLTDCKRISLFLFENGSFCSNRLNKDMRVLDSKRANRTKEERNAIEIKTDRVHGEKRRVEKKRKEYEDFVSLFREITKKAVRGDAKSERQFNARIEDGYSRQDFETAIKNCFADPYHIQNPKYLTCEFITRADKLQMYLLAKPEQKPIIEVKHSDIYGNV